MKDFTAARLVCQSEGGYLATVDSVSTNSFLANMMKDQKVKTAWLGGSLKKTGWHWGQGKYSNMHMKYMFTLYHVRIYIYT